MARHPLRKYLLALDHPDGLQGARKDLAARLGCHPGSVRNVDSALRRPSWDFALRLEQVTEGVVKAERVMRAPLRSRAA